MSDVLPGLHCALLVSCLQTLLALASLVLLGSDQGLCYFWAPMVWQVPSARRPSAPFMFLFLRD